MFDHPLIEKYGFEDIPLDRDVYLMDEKWMAEYKATLLGMIVGGGGDTADVGYVSYASVRVAEESAIELSWSPNVFDRFHEVKISLPKDQFVDCIGCSEWDEKPRIFVKGDWLTNLHLRAYSVFAMVDAIGVKSALKNGTLTRALGYGGTRAGSAVVV